MNRMRGTPRMRLLFAVLSPLFLIMCVYAIHSEEGREWRQYQDQFAQLLVDRAQAKLQNAGDDEREAARWRRIIAEASQSQAEIKQIYLEDIKVADRCTTCHLGIDNPLFEDAPLPFRMHPQAVLETHDVKRFACTLCHGGQGLATTADEAHGQEANWSQPLRPTTALQGACAGCHEVTHGLAGVELVTKGADLFVTNGCTGCHDIRGGSDVPKLGPPLTKLKSKLVDPSRWVQAWIADPSSLAPETVMPNFHLKEEETGQLAAFLLTPEAQTRAIPFVPDDTSVDEGKRLFTERGCRGCHGVDKDEASVSARVPHLGAIASKVTAEWLDEWIADPAAYNADTAMPKLELTDEERRAIVSYLLTLKRTEPLPETPDVSRFDAAKGKELLKQYECYGCHAIEGFEDTRPSVPDLGEFARKPIEDLDFGAVEDLPRTKWDWLRHKLRKPRAFESEQIKLKMPTHTLTDDEVEALVAFSLGQAPPPLPAGYVVPASDNQRALRNASWSLARLNCNGCHPLGDKEAHLAQFVERKSRVGPTLDGVGARLQGQYLYEYLREPKQVRPWLAIRMPTFGFTEDQARTLAVGLATADGITNPYTHVAAVDAPVERSERGFRRFRHYKCIQCHPSDIEEGLPADLDPDDLSINLLLSKERLRPEWLHEFLARPKQIAGTQTRMPTVFYTVDGVPKVERPEDDINDIVLYLMTMKESPEVTLLAYEETIKEEEKKEQVDWTTFEY